MFIWEDLKETRNLKVESPAEILIGLEEEIGLTEETLKALAEEILAALDGESQVDLATASVLAAGMVEKTAVALEEEIQQSQAS